MYKEVFKARLKYTRKMAGFSQEKMAENLGIGRATYTHWELGNREPDIESLGKISEILNVNLAWLIGTENKIDNIKKS